jgi:hypothetical protein
MAQTAVTGFSEPFLDTHPFYRGYFRVVSRTATGSGDGSASVASGSAQVRLGQLTDFSFPYRFGGRFYLGVRAFIVVTATASGLVQRRRRRRCCVNGRLRVVVLGSESATRVVVLLRRDWFGCWDDGFHGVAYCASYSHRFRCWL